jgi:predicted nuclease with RNAse H fold
MSEIVVAGVDFSGAKTQPNDTWLTVAKVGGLGVEVLDVRKVGAHALAKSVAENASVKALGIDCPFSVPAEFAQFMAAKRLRADYQSWQEIAQDVVFMSQEEFIQLAKEFKKEPKRYTDQHCVVPAQSPLHRANPSMVQMTFHGMRLLAMLDPARFFVLPFQSAIPFGCSVIEIYPRATLHTLGLTETGYKSQEKSEQERMISTRANMLQGLVSLRDKKGISFQHFPRLSVAKRFEKTFVESDHALDSLIACYTTACFATKPELFADPFSSDNEDVLLEGWVYALSATAF